MTFTFRSRILIQGRLVYGEVADSSGSVHQTTTIFAGKMSRQHINLFESMTTQFFLFKTRLDDIVFVGLKKPPTEELD